MRYCNWSEVHRRKPDSKDCVQEKHSLSAASGDQAREVEALSNAICDASSRDVSGTVETLLDKRKYRRNHPQTDLPCDGNSAAERRRVEGCHARLRAELKLIIQPLNSSIVV